MNDVLQLKGHFNQMDKKPGFGRPSLSVGCSVGYKKILTIVRELSSVLTFWSSRQQITSGALLEIHYDSVIAKSNRTKKLLVGYGNGAMTDSDRVVGAKFSYDKKHVITYFMTLDQLRSAISRINEIADVVLSEFDGILNQDKIDKVYEDGWAPKITGLTRNQFVQNVVDMSRIEKIEIPDNLVGLSLNDEAKIVSIFDTGITIKEIFKKISIDASDIKIIDDFTALLAPSDLELLRERVPNLIAMAVRDMDEIDAIENKSMPEKADAWMPSPKNEPIVGVIDTGFNKDAYFAEWVDYRDDYVRELGLDSSDNEHGTAVSSIIVDGPRLNPRLDDGCGRFRVRHFAVGRSDYISASFLVKNVKKIVEENPDIKVWNLSLGTKSEVEENYISPVAAMLDDLQFKHDVIFVVSGTNIIGDITNVGIVPRIGSPADSINSIVVNAVDYEKQPASYTRKGEVLSFFVKPDVCYYGGDRRKGDYIVVCVGKTMQKKQYGTSFAAPWITRKVAYLIHILGLTREVAKALIIDSACDWNNENVNSEVAKKMGFGVVPIRIDDIVQTAKDEIKFVMSGESEKYDTFTYEIPVPPGANGFPYVAKATMCYFPKCNRNQGVDYSNTELDIVFGRLDNNGRILSINENTQNEEDGNSSSWVTESRARAMFRKWDNTKHLRQRVKEHGRPKKIYTKQEWGLSIKTKERLSTKYGEGLKFGVVITLKEINGVNRINDFIRLCYLRGWMVNRINIDARVDVYNKMQEDINFKDSNEQNI